MSATTGDLSPDREAPSDYNRVLEFYADTSPDDIDLVGLVAYALYKRQKRSWIIRHRELNQGTAPTSAELRAITTNYLTDDLRTTLRERATDLLSTYAETYVEALEPQIRADALNSETLRQAQAIEASITRESAFWRQIWIGLSASVIWTAIVTLLIAAAYFLGSDLVDAWQGVDRAVQP